MTTAHFFLLYVSLFFCFSCKSAASISCLQLHTFCQISITHLKPNHNPEFFLGAKLVAPAGCEGDQEGIADDPYHIDELQDAVPHSCKHQTQTLNSALSIKSLHTQGRKEQNMY